MTELRDVETTLIVKVLAAPTKATPQDTLTAVMQSAAPNEYQAYISKAREAARMLKSLYGDRNGTKFKSELIADEELMPRFP